MQPFRIILLVTLLLITNRCLSASIDNRIYQALPARNHQHRFFKPNSQGSMVHLPPFVPQFGGGTGVSNPFTSQGINWRQIVQPNMPSPRTMTHQIHKRSDFAPRLEDGRDFFSGTGDNHDLQGINKNAMVPNKIEIPNAPQTITHQIRKKSSFAPRFAGSSGIFSRKGNFYKRPTIVNHAALPNQYEISNSPSTMTHRIHKRSSFLPSFGGGGSGGIFSGNGSSYYPQGIIGQVTGVVSDTVGHISNGVRNVGNTISNIVNGLSGRLG